MIPESIVLSGLCCFQKKLKTRKEFLGVDLLYGVLQINILLPSIPLILTSLHIFIPRILSFASKEVNQDMLFKRRVGIEPGRSWCSLSLHIRLV